MRITYPCRAKSFGNEKEKSASPSKIPRDGICHLHMPIPPFRSDFLHSPKDGLSYETRIIDIAGKGANHRGDYYKLDTSNTLLTCFLMARSGYHRKGLCMSDYHHISPEDTYSVAMNLKNSPLCYFLKHRTVHKQVIATLYMMEYYSSTSYLQSRTRLSEPPLAI